MTRRLWRLGDSRLRPTPSSAGAEAALLEARRGFLLAGLGTEAAAVQLDLALLYQREGRAHEVRRLAGELFPILRAGGLRQGAAVALLFFRDLVETGRATPEGLFAVAGYLRGPGGEALLHSPR